MKFNSELGLIILIVTISLSGAIVLLASEGTQEIIVPNLKGTWSGECSSVSLGELSDREEADNSYFSSKFFTLTISEQNGRMFLGKRKSASYTENIVGYIDLDDKTLRFTDHDGYMTGEILPNGNISIGYLETGDKTRVASMTVFYKNN